MRVALLSSAIVLVTMTAAPASAQQAASGSAAGLRYLSWPGKPAAAATTAPATTTDLRPALPAEYAPQIATASSPVYGYTPAPQRMASNGLTPASNWLRPATEAAASSAPTPYAPAPTATASIPNPVFVPQPAPQPQSVRALQQQPVVEQPLVQAPPIQSGPIPSVAPPTARLVQAQPPLQMPEPQPQPQVQSQAAVDPMAPRRDAPIFRIQGQPQAQPTAAASEPQAQTYQTAQAAPGSSSARYYSVHRPLGRTPDPAPQPQPVYLDALPVELISPPQSADLAEPQSGPALIRNANGTVRAMPAASEGDHQ